MEKSDTSYYGRPFLGRKFNLFFEKIG